MAKKGKLNKTQKHTEDTRPFRPRRYAMFILIVCEDEKTEPYYFRQFRELFPKETVFIKEIGTGKKPLGIVKQAIDERTKFSEEARKEIDEVWVVFDKDDEDQNQTTIGNFEQAWQLAKQEHISIAFSNEVFELWLLLHFQDISPEVSLPRTLIYSQLGELFASLPSDQAFTYNHKQVNPPKVIGATLSTGDEQAAIQRAEMLLAAHQGKQPIKANPSTTVHLLVRKLRDLIEWYSDPAT